jgi:hypothetical protein
MRKPLYPLFLFLILVVFSCSDAVKVEENKPRIFPDYDVALDEIIRSNVGVIRGVDLNSKASIITQSETKLPTEVGSDFLYFEYQVDTNTNYSVSYNLKNDSLDEVEVQINCKDLELCSKLFSQLKTFYERKWKLNGKALYGLIKSKEWIVDRVIERFIYYQNIYCINLYQK